MNSQEVLWALIRHIESKANGDQFTYIPEFVYHDRRIDLLTVCNWPSHGYNRVAYEIKVSRSDFLGELKKGAKTDAMLKVASQAYFVTPKDIIKSGELPAGCGHIEASLQGCKYIVKAPPSTVQIDLTPGFAIDMMVQAVRRWGGIRNIIATQGSAEITAAHLKKARDDGYREGHAAGVERIEKKYRIDYEEFKKAERLEKSVRIALGLRDWGAISDDHLAHLEALHDNSPIALQRIKDDIRTHCKSLLKHVDDKKVNS